MQDTNTRPEACDRYTATGRFGLQYEQTWAGFSGFFGDIPSPLTMDLGIDGGDCQLYRWDHPPSCDPSCEGEEICGFGDQCRAWPAGLDAGVLTLTGTQPEIEIEPTEWNAYNYTEAWTDPYSVGETIVLDAPGSDDVEAFALSLPGAPPLDIERFEVIMRAGEPMTVSWEPSGGPDGQRMKATLSIDHHANSPAYAICEVSDASGSFTLSAAIVDALIQAGATGIGTYVENARLHRSTQAWAETSRGCVLFESFSESYFDVETEP